MEIFNLLAEVKLFFIVQSFIYLSETNQSKFSIYFRFGFKANMAEGKSKKRPLEDENSKTDKKTGKKIVGHWSQGLLSSMTDPDLIVESDDKMVVIRDKYPKVIDSS